MLLLGNVVLVLVLAVLVAQAVFFSRLTRLKDELDWRAYQAGERLLPAQARQWVRDLAATPGKKIEAIRAIRAEFGLGLKPAVRIFEALRTQAPNSGA